MSDTPLRRVLIITYYWPPSGGSGVQRWLKFAKYLPEFGWQPIIVAPEGADYPVVDLQLGDELPAELEVIRIPIKEPYAAYRKLTGAKQGEQFGAAPAAKPGLLKRLSLWIRANLFVPDPRIWWVKPSVKRLKTYLNTQPVEAVVTTGPPHSVHLIGQQLKSAFPSIKWVLDVRDPWAQFDIHLAFNPGKRARSKNERLESKALAAADVVLATAPSMVDHLSAFDHSKFRVVTNGYDAEDFMSAQSTSAQKIDSSSFHLYHTGLLNEVRNPTALWQALALLCEEDAGFAERLHIHLIGNVAERVSTTLASHQTLAGRYTITPWMDHDELLHRYAEADCFLLCPNRSDNAKGQINGKVFEYLASRRPILHVGPYDSDNTRILDETHAGLTVPPNDVDGMRAAILDIASGKFSKSEFAFPESKIEQYERRCLTQRLAQVLAE